MKKNSYGICHICGKFDNLSFEHIPPEAALNKKKVKVYSGENVIKSLHGEKPRYQDMQRGIGKFSLCEHCNSITGQWYATTYSQVAKDVVISRNKGNALNHGDIVEYTFKRLPALAFLKQIIAMFCSLLPWEEVHRIGFDHLMLNKESNAVDTSLFDLRMYLVSARTAHLLTGPMITLYLSEDNTVESSTVVDLCAYPFGFILNLSPEVSITYGTSLMDLFKCRYGKEYSVTLQLMYLERKNEQFPLPLQFQPIIIKDEKEGKKT